MVVGVRRIEVITGTGRRRRWSSDDRVRILLESLKPGANVSEVARRHGLSPQQREARAALIGGSAGKTASTTRADPESRWTSASRRTALRRWSRGTVYGADYVSRNTTRQSEADGG